MSDKLTYTQKEILLAYNDTPDHRSMDDLIAEYNAKNIFSHCVELKNRGYFIDNIEFTYTLKGTFRADVVNELGTLPASMCYVLSLKGMDAIRKYI